MYIPELIRKAGLRRGLSHRTIKTYNDCVRIFFKNCKKDPKEVKKQDIKNFLDKLIEGHRAGNTINVYLNALNFFYREVLNKKLMMNIRYSKTPKTLPTILTKEEVIRLIEAIKNTKHKLMVKLIYSAGLRVSELVHLRVKDLEFDKNYGWVRKGKGNKDRLFIIAKSIKYELSDYLTKEDISYDEWLFKSQKHGHLTVKAVQWIIKRAAKNAKIIKNVHPHTLRHSFATHLIENGQDVASIQSLLGHNSSETTMVYIHTANSKMIAVRSPLDNLEIPRENMQKSYNH